jgi:ribosomal protein S14
MSGRPRAYYRKLVCRVSRCVNWVSLGSIPGLVKSSW